jgi:hypothetical protein
MFSINSWLTSHEVVVGDQVFPLTVVTDLRQKTEGRSRQKPKKHVGISDMAVKTQVTSLQTAFSVPT